MVAMPDSLSSDASADVDDPFNLRSKTATRCFRDDLPLPRTKAAMQLMEAEGAEAEEELRQATHPLTDRDGNVSEPPVSGPRGERTADSGKENVVRSHAVRGKRHGPAQQIKRGARVETRENTSGAAAGGGADAGEGGAARTAASATESGLAEVSAQHLPIVAPLLNESAVSGLSSRQWAECVASIDSLRQAAEAQQGGDSADVVRAAVLVLCHTPGLGCSNQAVWKAVSEACHILLAAAPVSLPTSVIRAVVPSLLLRLSDRRASPVASSLLLRLAEASSARTVQRCVAACIEEQHKNARLVEHALLFLSALAADFSPAALTLPALLDLCRSLSDHPQPPVRAAVCQVLASLYAQLDPSFRQPLVSTVAATMHATLEAALAAVDRADAAVRQAHSTPPLRGRGDDNALVPVTLDAVFPRVDLCSKLGADVLSGLRDKQWKARQSALQQLGGALEQLQHRATLRDGGAAALIGGLAPLLSDSNKMLAMQAMAVLRQLVSAVGDSVGRWRDKLLPAVLAGVVDAKKAVREQAAAVLREWVSRLGLHSVLRLVHKALETANSSGRVELLELLLAHRAEEAEWGELVAVSLDCLCDKSGEVRAAADRLIEALVLHCGYGTLNAALHRMKEAYVVQLQPTLDRHRHARRDRAAEGAREAAPQPTSASSGSQQLANQQQQPQHVQSVPDSEQKQLHAVTRGEQGSSALRAAASTAEDSDRAKRSGSGKRKQPTQSGSAAHRKEALLSSQPPPHQPHAAHAQHQLVGSDDGAQPSDANCHPFLSRVDVAAKQKRLLRDGKRLQSGAFREWSAEERDETAHTLAALVSPSMHSAMISADFAKLLHAVHFFHEQLALQPPAVHAIADVLLRWLSALMGDASPKLLMAILALLSALFSSYHSHGLHLADAEMMNAAPFIVERLMGHNVQRVRKDAAALLLSLAARQLFSRAKLISALLQGLDSKNRRVVAECCDCIGQLWGAPTSGGDVQLAVWNEMKRGLPQVALLLSATGDPAVRMSALSAIVSAHGAIGEQLWVVLTGHAGQPLSEKVLSMIEERVKRTRMDASAAAASWSAQLHPASVVDDSHALPPPSSTTLPVTPVKRAAAVQRTPLSANSAVYPTVASPSSQWSAAASLAANRSKGRKQSTAPTLSALNTSLASLEAMHTNMANQQQQQPAVGMGPASPYTAPTSTASPALPTPLSALVAALSNGTEAEQTSALVSLSAAVGQTPELDAVIQQHSGSILSAVARSLRTTAVAEADRRDVLRLSHALCASRPCVERIGAESASDLCHALLASTARYLQAGGAADAAHEDANMCVQAVLECRGTMEQFTLLASVLLSSLISSSPYLSSLVAPFLARWSGVQRLHCEAAAVDVSALLSWLHRLLVAVRSCASSCERGVLECLDQLAITARECAGSEQRLLALLSGYPADSSLLARMVALGQRSIGGEECRVAMHGSPSKAVHIERPFVAVLGETSEPPASIEAAAPNLTADGVRLEQLLNKRSPAAVSTSSRSAVDSAEDSSSTGLSYIDRFHALQQRLRRQDPSPPTIHRTADFPFAHTDLHSQQQLASPTRRNSTGSSSSGATSSVSAILRDMPVHSHSTASTDWLPAAAVVIDQPLLAPTPLPATDPAGGVSRSAAFEAMRQKMRAKYETDCTPAAATHTEAPCMTLSALLASPAKPAAPSVSSVTRPSPPPPPPPPSPSRLPSAIPRLTAQPASSSSDIGESGSSSAVSALRARLAAIHAANRMASAASRL